MRHKLEKGASFLLWLEEERADAVAIHLDSLARRPKNARRERLGTQGCRLGRKHGPVSLRRHVNVSAQLRVSSGSSSGGPDHGSHAGWRRWQQTQAACTELR